MWPLKRKEIAVKLLNSYCTAGTGTIFICSDSHAFRRVLIIDGRFSPQSPVQSFRGKNLDFPICTIPTASLDEKCGVFDLLYD